MTSISQALQNTGNVNPLLYPPEVRKAACDMFARLANNQAVGVRCNSLREFTFRVPNLNERAAVVCERATQTFKLFANVLAQFNRGQERLFYRVNDIGTDHVCLQMYATDVPAFQALNFRDPYNFLAGT